MSAPTLWHSWPNKRLGLFGTLCQPSTRTSPSQSRPFATPQLSTLRESRCAMRLELGLPLRIHSLSLRTRSVLRRSQPTLQASFTAGHVPITSMPLLILRAQTTLVPTRPSRRSMLRIAYSLLPAQVLLITELTRPESGSHWTSTLELTSLHRRTLSSSKSRHPAVPRLGLRRPSPTCRLLSLRLRLLSHSPPGPSIMMAYSMTIAETRYTHSLAATPATSPSILSHFS